MQNDLKRKTKQGRYSHLKSKPKSGLIKRKQVERVILIVLLAFAIVGFIIQIVTQTK